MKVDSDSRRVKLAGAAARVAEHRIAAQLRGQRSPHAVSCADTSARSEHLRSRSGPRSLARSPARTLRLASAAEGVSARRLVRVEISFGDSSEDCFVRVVSELVAGRSVGVIL